MPEAGPSLTDRGLQLLARITRAFMQWHKWPFLIAVATLAGLRSQPAARRPMAARALPAQRPVPTLYDLLQPPAQRPKAFARGLDVIDRAKGGFAAPPCTPGAPAAGGSFCFDASQRGNSNAGHAWGTDLPADRKADLLAYLMTF